MPIHGQNEAVIPNLFIIGAQKSGTTSLHTYLGRHPEVYMSEPKEPGYFVPEVTYYPSDLDWYLGLFAKAGEYSVVGESSTHYSKRPLYQGVPERIAALSPEARFIYIMRDPIARAISHYWHNTRTFEETRPFMDAIRSVREYRDFGDYRMQLEPYFELFGRERVMTLTFERLTADPRDTINSVFSWLGLKPSSGEGHYESKNARPETIARAAGRGGLKRIAHSGAWGRVSPYVPKSIKSIAKRFAERPVSPSSVPNDQVVEFLRPWALERIEALRELLGREFPEWKLSLDPDFPGSAPDPPSASHIHE